MAIITDNDSIKISSRIRFLLGDPTQRTLTDKSLGMIITDCMAEMVGSEYCNVLFKCLMNTLDYLTNTAMREYAETSNLKSINEVNGKRAINHQYKDMFVDPWDHFRTLYRKYPEKVCPDLKGTAAQAGVIFGGVSEQEYQRVNNNPDGINGMDNTKTPRSRFNGRRYTRTFLKHNY